MICKTLETKKASVLIVEKAEWACKMILDAIKPLGFSNIKFVYSIEDAISILELEPVDWMLSSLHCDSTKNIFQFLALVLEEKRIQNVRVSLLVQDTELDLIPMGFELGALSWHPFSGDQNNFKVRMNEFVDLIKELKFDDVLISSHYLRTYLLSERYIESVRLMEKSLLDIYPSDPRQMVYMSSAHLEFNELESTQKYIRAACCMDPYFVKKYAETSRFKKFYLNPDNFTKKELNDVLPQEMFRDEAVLIVDSDSIVAKKLKEYLIKFGFKEDQIKSFEDGESCWSFVESCEKLALVVQEWSIPKLNGPFLAQRILNKFPKAHIFVTSSQIANQDIPFLNEMNISHTLAKPYSYEALSIKIMDLIQIKSNPTKQKDLEADVLRTLKTKNPEDAYTVIDSQLNRSDVYYSQLKFMIDGAVKINENRPNEALSLFIKSFNLGNRSVSAINFIGKCLLKIGDFKSALKFLEKADSISPMNIDRLCDISNAHFNDGNMDAAKDVVEKAKKMDPTNENVKAQEAIQIISQGKTDKAKKFLSTMNSVERIPSLINTKSITLAKGGKFEESFVLYEKLIDIFNEVDKDFIPSVVYNLSLAYVRSKNIDKAYEKISSIEGLGDEKLRRKIKSIKSKIEEFKEKGSVIKLSDSSEQKGSSEEFSLSNRFTSRSASNICCSGVFNLVEVDYKRPDLIQNRLKILYRNT